MADNGKIRNGGALAVGQTATLLAAIGSGIARHADDVGRCLLRNADEFVATGARHVDDLGGQGFRISKEVLWRVDDAGRPRLQYVGGQRPSEDAAGLALHPQAGPSITEDLVQHVLREGLTHAADAGESLDREDN